jgi:hypothetical protein
MVLISRQREHSNRTEQRTGSISDNGEVICGFRGLLLNEGYDVQNRDQQDRNSLLAGR